MTELSWPAVLARRLARHSLTAPPADPRPVEVVAGMCGAHAQVMSAAELSVALRLPDATRVDVREALWGDRSLVKTFGPRGTVHLLPTRDLAMWTGALSAVPARNAFAPDVRLTPEEVDEVVAAVGASLADAELTIDELDEAVVARAGKRAGDPVMPAFQTMWPRWRQVMSLAAHRGVLCFGANRGRKVTYTNPHRWQPGFRPAPDAAGELLERYLYSYGPATPAQYARWLATSVRWATELFEARGDRLAEVTLAGAPAWQLADDPLPEGRPAGLRLLPYFDAYGVGSFPRELVFPGRASERALARSQAGNFPVLLIDGVVAGVWHQRRSGRKLAVTVEPLSDLTAAQRRDLDDQVERTAMILEATPTLTIGKITVGAHA